MLRAAHQGYEYQDLLAAIRIVDLLLGTVNRIHVDEKLVPDDRFDDLTISWASGLWERCQFKFRDNAGRPLSLATFTSDARGCKLDRLVLSAIADRRVAERTERLFRLVVRDTAPDDERLIRVLRQVDSPGSVIPGLTTRRYRLDPEKLWPIPAAPKGDGSGRTSDGRDTWAFLRDGSISRDDVIWFCEHFVIEVDAPAASFDLTMPGAVEHVVLQRMVRDIGAGAFPNEHRTAVDVATAFVGAARAARSGTANLTRDELIRRARLRIDFGAVARTHPIVADLEVSRVVAIGEIAEAAVRAAADGVPLLLVGPPGAGKSWACQRVLEALLAKGWLVAEHYCFLDSGDAERDRRVAVETLIGSLLGRIAEADPALVESQRPKFAAGEQALVAAIEASISQQPERRVALLVDGLDHVTRVIGATTGQSDPSRLLAEELALLQLPRGSVVIVASQPGPHLEPLSNAGAVTMRLPAWTRDEIANLAETLGIIPGPEPQEQALVAHDDLESATAVVDALSERSSGNPLFATYLCRELLRSRVAAADPVGFVLSLPAFGDTLELYYDHLVSALGHGKWVADTVALLDFSVTRTELREIYPELAHNIDEVVELLGPVLAEKSTQGGIRVYHESFARYLLRSLEKDPGAAKARLGQVTAWLQQRGFLTDSRAYRYLLPLWVRAERDSEVVASVGTDFVAKSVAAGFGAAAISANLAVAVGSAGRIGDWPAIVRCVELARSAAQYEFDNLASSVVEFADVSIELLGASTFADRLLYDGRTTVPSRAGLQLCAAVDRAGAAAPWREYLDAFDRDRQTDNTIHGEDSDRAVWLAWLRGRLRTVSRPDVELPQRGSVDRGAVAGSQGLGRRVVRQVDPRRLAAWLEEKSLPADEVIEAIVATSGLEMTGEVVRCLSPSTRGTHALALAECLAGNVEISVDPSMVRNSALEWAREGRAVGIPSGSIGRLLALGMDVQDLGAEYSREQLLDLSRRVQERGIQFEPAPLFGWLDAVELGARLDPFGLSAAEGVLFGPGWYRCWLRFAIGLARSRVSGVSSEALDALRVLTEELDPFVGDPRACDLYRLHGVISFTIRRALSLIGSDEWRAALEVLGTVSERMSTTISGELGGPVPRDLVLQLVVEFTDASRVRVSDEFVREFVAGDRGRRYYSDIGRFELLACRLALAADERARAAERYERAATLFVAYGRHKDITIYELLGSLAALIAANRREGCVRLSRVQPLCELVIEHTDGKETRHAPAEWWKHLVVADPGAAGSMLLDGLLAWPNMPRARLEKAREDLWRAQQHSADPVVSAALRLTLDVPLDGRDPGLVDRLADVVTVETGPIIRRLAEWVMSRCDERSSRSASTTSGSEGLGDRELLEALNRAGRRLGITPIGREPRTARRPEGVIRLPDEILSAETRVRGQVLITYGPGITALIRGIRQWLGRPYGAWGDRWDPQRFINAVGYRLIQLYQAEASDEAETVLRLIADGLRFGDDERILEALANGLELRGAKSLAMLAHVLAFTRSRGGGGWLTFGDENHLESLRRAMALDERRVLSILPAEVQRVGGSNGVTRALIHAFAALGVSPKGVEDSQPAACALAFQMWDAAFEVIEARLPRTHDEKNLGQAYVPDESGSRRSELDTALAEATVGGLAHPGRERKRRGLLAVYLLTCLRPTRVGPALNRALRVQLDTLTLTWLLELLAATELHALADFVREPLGQLAAAPELRIRTIARRVLRLIGDPPGALPATSAETGLLDDQPARIIRPRLGTSTENMRDVESENVEEEMGSANARDTRRRAAAELVEEVAGARLERAGTALPGLRAIVVARVANELDTVRFQRRIRDQLDHLMSAGRSQWPDAILASDESVENALQKIAAGGRAAFAAAGRLIGDPDGWELSLAAALDDAALQALAVEATRIPRPGLPLPPGRSAQEWARARRDGEQERIRTLQTVSAGNCAPCLAYGGADWRVIGLVESRYLHRERYPYERDGEITRMAALEIRSPLDAYGLGGAPFGYGDVRVWDDRHLISSEGLSVRTQPLIGMIGGPGTDKSGEWPRLGYAAPFLAPQEALMTTLGLVAKSSFLDLTLYDTEGSGLVLRTWRSLYETSEYELPRPSIVGGALLLRSDLFDKLLNATQGRLTWREHIVGMNIISNSTETSQALERSSEQ
jgi:hypothetical protein